MDNKIKVFKSQSITMCNMYLLLVLLYLFRNGDVCHTPLETTSVLHLRLPRLCMAGGGS